MSYPALENYLARLPSTPTETSRVWRDAAGRVQGRFFAHLLSSAFQPVRECASGNIIGYEAFAHSDTEADAGATLHTLLDEAANDEESVALDRLCRMLHAMNYFRQKQATNAELYLSVHGRLLSSVSGNHGMAFKRILEGLGLPVNNVILQLPLAAAAQGWLLPYVADNYRLNGFRFAVCATDMREALQLLDRVRPAAIRLDAGSLADFAAAEILLKDAQQLSIRVIFQKLAQASDLAKLRQLSQAVGQEIFYMQGPLLDAPQLSLETFALS